MVEAGRDEARGWLDLGWKVPSTLESVVATTKTRTVDSSPSYASAVAGSVLPESTDDSRSHRLGFLFCNFLNYPWFLFRNLRKLIFLFLL